MIPLALHQLGLHDCDMLILAMPPNDFTVEKAKRLWMVKFTVIIPLLLLYIQSFVDCYVLEEKFHNWGGGNVQFSASKLYLWQSKS